MIHVALQNPSKPAAIFPCSLLNFGISGDAAELFLHVSNVLQSTYQEINVVLGSPVAWKRRDFCLK